MRGRHQDMHGFPHNRSTECAAERDHKRVETNETLIRTRVRFCDKGTPQEYVWRPRKPLLTHALVTCGGPAGNPQHEAVKCRAVNSPSPLHEPV